MTGQRDQIEVIRDCLRILEFIISEDGEASLTTKQITALEILATEHLDSLLEPIYHRIENTEEPITPAAAPGEASSLRP